MRLLELSKLGARQRPGSKTIDFGLYLPWINADEGYAVLVKLIHERDQFIQKLSSLEFPLNQTNTDPTCGAYWSGSVNIETTQPSVGMRNWGNSGRYLYRFEIKNTSSGRSVDWVIDPFAREYGVGKTSAFTLDYESYRWSVAENSWKVPNLHDLVAYELHLGEFANGIKGAIAHLDYLADLGINCLEIMPISNVVEFVRWGFQPIGFFGVDDRFGDDKAFQKLIDEAHQKGIAVILDVVFGHTGHHFPYSHLYRELGFPNNPFHAACFGTDYEFGERTDFCNPYVEDFFYTVSHYLLDHYHVDGFRYDCVPEYWDPIGMKGYHALVFSTYQEVKKSLGTGYWRRFRGENSEVSLIQCAEQLDAPREAIANTYGNCTWQNWTLDTAYQVATQRGDNRGYAIRNFGLMLGLHGFSRHETMNGEGRAKTAFQYIETHDKSRFINLFGLEPDPKSYHLFPVGNRENWSKLQPYLIAMLLADGIPMLWQGQELCENNALPGKGEGRVGFLRPMHWEYFYDKPGRKTLELVRKLLGLRKREKPFRRGEYYFFDNWNHLIHNVLIYRRRLDEAESIVAVNFGDTDQTIDFSFERGGNYREELHGSALDLDLLNIQSGATYLLDIPSNYGRVWTRKP